MSFLKSSVYAIFNNEKGWLELKEPNDENQKWLDIYREYLQCLYNSFYHDICSVFNYNNSDFSLSERKNIIDLSDEMIDNLQMLKNEIEAI